MADKATTRIMISEQEITDQTNKAGGLSFLEKLLIVNNQKLDDCAKKEDIEDLRKYNDKQDLLIRTIRNIQESCIINNAQKIWKTLGFKVIVGAGLGGGAFYGLKEIITYLFTIL